MLLSRQVLQTALAPILLAPLLTLLSTSCSLQKQGCSELSPDFVRAQIAVHMGETPSSFSSHHPGDARSVVNESLQYHGGPNARWHVPWLHRDRGSVSKRVAIYYCDGRVIPDGNHPAERTF